jgi:hypothetical protein
VDHNSGTAHCYNTTKEDTSTLSGQVDDAYREEEILKISFKDKILNRRNLMNINKIRLQHNFVDYNIKIMKHQGTWEVRK